MAGGTPLEEKNEAVELFFRALTKLLVAVQPVIEQAAKEYTDNARNNRTQR